MPPELPLDRSPKSSKFSVLSTASYSRNQILEIFNRADEISQHGFTPAKRRRVLGFLFFEPSTRTRMSFQMAAHRLGHDVITLENAASSSLSKGETYLDTVLNVAAMKPDALVIRYGVSPELDDALPRMQIPVLNAGSGTNAHPTQALLDAYTIYREKGRLDGVKVLIVGDIRHSRVASSNFDLLTKLGAEMGVCGPAEFVPASKLPPGARVFESLDDATTWCDVYMGLRIQLERHSEAGFPEAKQADLSKFHDSFGLTRARLQLLKKDAMILHPGPINHGVEFPADDSVMKDSRNRVLEQVSNGVLIRAVLLEQSLGDA